MGIKERRAKQREGVRAAILDAARWIALERGWQAVTIRRIAERIEYSPPVLYGYFDSKEDLLLELMRIGYAEQLLAVETAVDTAKDPEGGLFAITEAWWRFAVSSPDLYQVMYGLGGVSFPVSELRREGEKIGDVVGTSIERFLRENGRSPDGIRDKVSLLWSTIHGLVALGMAGRIEGGTAEARRLADAALRDYMRAWLEA